MKPSRLFTLLGIMTIGMPGLFANEPYPYNPAGNDLESWGTSKKENYDIATLVKNEDFTGSEIVGIEIPFECGDVENVSIWISSSLNLENGVNVPDILSEDVVPTDNKLSLQLTSPIVVPAEGLYVGYSFSLSALTMKTQKPVTVSPAVPGWMYVHSSRKYLKWGTYDLPYAPVMTVNLKGNFSDNCAVPFTPEDAGALKEVPVAAVLNISNHGLNPISSIDLTLDINGKQEEKHYDYSPALGVNWNLKVPVDIDLGSWPTPGEYSWTATITKVNGETNAAASNVAEGKYYVYSHYPQRRPLIEEFTGTWCGWCPRGIIGMEYMNSTYPEDFVCAVYHVNVAYDPMAMLNVDTYPCEYEGAPTAYIDRKKGVIDPYYGETEGDISNAAEGIGQTWLKEREIPSMADFEVQANWKDEEMSEVVIKSSSTFLRRYNQRRFRVVYILTQDGMKDVNTDTKDDDQWLQHNYYSGDAGYEGTQLASLITLPEVIEDIEFNDVAIYSSDNERMSWLASDIEANVPEVDIFRINLNSAVNLKKKSLVQDKTRIHVVAALIDSFTDEVVNSSKCDIGDSSSVKGIDNDDTVKVSAVGGRLAVEAPAGSEVSAWNLQGIKVDSMKTPADGKGIMDLPKGISIIRVATDNGVNTYRIMM